MFYVCCVCKNSRKDAIIHRFPINSEKRLNKWLKCLKRDDLSKLSLKQLEKYFICQRHFERKFITSKMRLSSKAYPTLFSDDEISSGYSARANAENLDPRADHNYARNKHFDHTYCRSKPLKEINTGALVHLSRTTPSQSFWHETEAVSSVSSMNLPETLQTNLTSSESAANKVRKSKKQRISRKRLVKRFSDLTPTCQVFYTEYKKAKKQNNYLLRAKRALKFSKEKSLEKLTEGLTPYAKKIINMQINLCMKNKKGRRYTLEEKFIALSIMKQSPKCYKFLSNIFILPSKTTLNKMVSTLNIEPGICKQVFELLKKEVATWDEKKKLCSVIFDEMSLEAALTYDKSRDSINGFVELSETRDEFADHALVFMLRGAVYKWQQPLAFYYCQGATSSVDLKNILKQVIAAIQGCGLNAIGLICDQGSSFQSVIKNLKEDTKREQLRANKEPDGAITISGVNLQIFYDPSHLIKGLRNNFLNKNIVLDGKISKWSDIVDVYETDCDNINTRLLYKLNDQHVIPDKIKKMKVKNCIQVFSKTVSAALIYTSKFSHYADGRVVSSTIKNTAEMVNFFDELFDSVNGAATVATKNKGKPLRSAVSEKSYHHSFWVNAIKKLEKMRFVDSMGKEKSVPSIKNFIITIKSYMRLWQILKSQGIKIMRPKYFNSDPIENFFGQVRAYNYRNNDPNCHSFNCTFKSLLITRIIKFHNETFNCEDDPADGVIHLHSLFNSNKRVQTVKPDHPITENNIEMIVEQARRERLNVHSRAYTAGWVVRKIFDKIKIKCNLCKKSLTSDSKVNIHDWISQREFSDAKLRLNYPSEGAVRCFGTVISETNEYLENNAQRKYVANNIKDNIMKKYSFDFINCTEHKTMLLNIFIALTVRFTIMNWCSNINKILKGTDIFRLRNRVLQKMHLKAFIKFKKKLKNKCFKKYLVFFFHSLISYCINKLKKKNYH